MADAVKRPWIDTCTDVPYPPSVGSRTLRYLAADHLFINPFPHRAIFDVMTMLTVLSHYNVEEIAVLAKSPVIHVQAKVGYDEREKAKARGYMWEGQTGSLGQGHPRAEL